MLYLELKHSDWKRNQKNNQCRKYQQISVMTCLLHGLKNSCHALRFYFLSPKLLLVMIPQAWLILQHRDSLISQKQQNGLAHGKPLHVQMMGPSGGTVSDFLLKNPIIITSLIPSGAQCTTATCCTPPAQKQIYDIKDVPY